MCPSGTHSPGLWRKMCNACFSRRPEETTEDMHGHLDIWSASFPRHRESCLDFHRQTHRPTVLTWLVPPLAGKEEYMFTQPRVVFLLFPLWQHAKCPRGRFLARIVKLGPVSGAGSLQGPAVVFTRPRRDALSPSLTLLPCHLQYTSSSPLTLEILFILAILFRKKHFLLKCDHLRLPWWSRG